MATFEMSLEACGSPAVDLRATGPFTALEARLLKELFPDGYYAGHERVGWFRHEHIWRCTIRVNGLYCLSVSSIVKQLRDHGLIK